MTPQMGPMPLSFMPPNGAISVDADDAVFERLGDAPDAPPPFPPLRAGEG